MKLIAGFKLLAALSLISLTSIGQVTNGQRAEPKHARFPASRTTLQGEVWLSWQFPVREWFVEAAIVGYEAGYKEGCANGTRSKKSSKAIICPKSSLYHGKAFDYSTQMTDFYNQHPEDRDLPLAYLIHMLIGPKPKTLDEIHQWTSSVGQ